MATRSYNNVLPLNFCFVKIADVMIISASVYIQIPNSMQSLSKFNYFKLGANVYILCQIAIDTCYEN